VDLANTHEWINSLITIVRDAPQWQSGLLLLFAASAEYIFPPFPGDTVLVVGGFFAAQGAIRFDLVFAALILGTWLGTLAGWSIGHFAMRYERSRALLVRIIQPRNIEKLKNLYARRGNWILFGNRFLPGIRGTFMIAAGMVGVSLGRVLFWSTLSALLWNTLLILAGFWFGKNLDAMISFFENYTLVLYLVMAAVVLFFLIRFLWKRIRR